MNKRKKVELTPEERMKMLIVRIGDQGLAQANSNITKLQNEIEANISTLKNTIVQCLSEAICLLPSKEQFYARIFIGPQPFIPDLLKDIIKAISAQL